MINVSLGDREWSYLLRIADSHLKELVTGRAEPRDPQERYFVGELCQNIILAMQHSRTEVDDDAADDEYPQDDEAPARPYAAPWWDRAELANWKLIPEHNGLLTLRHEPCGEVVNGITMLTYAVRRAADHRCPMDRPAEAPVLLGADKWTAYRPGAYRG